ncbi:MAG: hypothetical protein K9N48_02625 [Verrucomicrobia bacterium]|nr:hypothetical protein [Verrucomicrobiota bacterium]MCF7708971.1 hypothetical protein [Verrucomicrobiota bacterium]
MPLSILIGFGIYLGIMQYTTGNYYAGFDAEKHYSNNPTIIQIFDIVSFWKAFIAIESLIINGYYAAIDRIIYIINIILLIILYRENKTLFWIAAPLAIIPPMANHFVSYRRFSIVCFPIFMVAAKLICPNKSLYYYIIAVLLILQIYLIWNMPLGAWMG